MAHVRLRLAAWGWNASGLSKELKKAQAAGVGKGTSQQALSDLLADRPGRRLSLDQVVAIAFVLDIPMADIVQDPDALTDPIVRSEFDALASARNDMHNAQEAYDNHLRRLRVLLERHPLAASSIRQRARRVAESNEAELRGMATNDTQPQPTDEELRHNISRVPTVAAALDVLGITYDELDQEGDTP